jgi:hypothetical protein
VTNGDQNVPDVFWPSEPGEIPFTVSTCPARPDTRFLACCWPRSGACELSGLLIVATAEWLGHRRWCVLMGGWPGLTPRPMNLVS